MDLISIIIPVYKVEKYLRRCLDSVLNQSYKNLDIILVDDGSPDKCGDICDEYSKKDSRVRVIHKKNAGLSDARNTGLNMARGNYVAFVDSDDYIDAVMYERLHDAIINNNADIAICGFRKINEDGKPIESINVGQALYSGFEILNSHLMTKWEYWVVAWNKLYKKCLFDDIKYPKGKIHEDSFIVHELFYKAERVICIVNNYYNYQKNPESIQGKTYSCNRLDDVEACYNRIDFYLTHRLSPQMMKKVLDSARGKLYISYASGLRKTDEFRKRYSELNRQYRGLYRRLVFCNFSIKEKIVMSCHYISPYLVWIMSKIKKVWKLIQR